MNRRRLFVTIGISGAATLLLEVTATRLLAPYFGNSIYVLASVLAVVLGCLSLGYWVGGILAGRRDPTSVLFTAITLAGISGLLIAVFMVTVMPAIGLRLPLTWGPLAASLLLFSLPSTCLGMVAPAAVRLHPLARTAVSRASGEVLAVSTVGSIAGSLLGGFLLIPQIGLRWTVLGTAAALILLGMHGLVSARVRIHRLMILSVVLLAPVAFLARWTWFLGNALVHEKSTPYQHVLIADRPNPDRGDVLTRTLIADHALMSGEERETGAPAFAYVEGILRMVDNLPTPPARLAILGGGAFTIPRILHERYPEMVIDAVEIDPELVRIATEFFRLRPDPHLRIHTTDGRRFLHEHRERYDVVILDMYQSLSIPPHTLTEEFFALLASRVEEDGVAVLNIIGLSPDVGPSLPLAVAHTAGESFPFQSLLAMPSDDEPRNFLLFLSRTDHPLHAAEMTDAGALVPPALTRKEDTATFRDDRVNTIRYDVAHARALRD